MKAPEHIEHSVLLRILFTFLSTNSKITKLWLKKKEEEGKYVWLFIRAVEEL